MADEWPADEFDARLRRAPRVVVLFRASWCPHSRIFQRDFDEADAESPLPFAQADLSHLKDARWEEHRVGHTPTVLYFEHGEELERVAAAPHRGLARDAFDQFLETVHALQEPEVPRWLLDRRGKR